MALRCVCKWADFTLLILLLEIVLVIIGEQLLAFDRHAVKTYNQSWRNCFLYILYILFSLRIVFTYCILIYCM